MTTVISEKLREQAEGCDFYIDQAQFSQKIAREHGLYVDPQVILDVTLPFLIYSNGDFDHMERIGYGLVEAVLKHGRKIAE